MNNSEFLKPYRSQLAAVLFFTALGLGWMFFLCLNSEGMEVQDEIAHFNISRAAWGDPRLVLNIWGRPFNTIVYMLPALHSWLAARLTSIFLSFVTLMLAILTGEKIGIKRLYLIPVF